MRWNKNKCSFKGCPNISADFSYFRFPTKDPNRLRIWLQNADNKNLEHLSTKQLRNRYICDTHFEESFILCRGKQVRLSYDAVPIKNISSTDNLYGPTNIDFLEVKNPTKVYSNKKMDMKMVETSSENSSAVSNADNASEHDMELAEDQPASWSSQDLPRVKLEYEDFVSEELPLETSFKCTECYSFSIGPMVTCVQCSNITICLKCDREGRHQFHCLLKMPKKQYMDAVKDYLSKVREMFARLLINFKDEEEKQKTELIKKETRKAKKTKAKVKKIPTTTLQKQKTSINSPHRKTTSEDTEGSKQLVKKIKENTNQQQPDTKQPKIEMIGPSASSQENDFVIQPTSSSNVAYQTCGAPQVNVPALTPGVISTSTPSTAADEAGDHLALPAKRTADDVECEKRLAVKGIKVEIKEEEMYEVEILDESMMVVGDVKTEPPDELTTGIDPVAVIRTEKNS